MATPTLLGPRYNSTQDLVSQAGAVIERAKDRADQAAAVQRITAVIARSIGQAPEKLPAARTVMTIAQIEASAAEGNRYAKAWATRISRYGIGGTRNGTEKPVALKPTGVVVEQKVTAKKPAEQKPVLRAVEQEQPVYSTIRAEAGGKTASLSPAQLAGKF